jgi:hypothetical protein
MLVGRDDVAYRPRRRRRHQARAGLGGDRHARAPGKEAEYRAWERKIAVAQSKAPGTARLPLRSAGAGRPEDFVAILRF